MINKQESERSVMTYRFEEEDYENIYILEDYYCTNPFCDCNHVTVSFCDKENAENRMTFLLNFNKTHSSMPNQPKWTTLQTQIISGFAKDFPDELLVLFKQRYTEAKAYGEKNPLSYLILEPGKFVNYFEMFPRNDQMLDFTHGEDKMFAEDSYDLDPRNNDKSVRLMFYKLELDNDKKPALFTYTFEFNEKAREQVDAKLASNENNIVMALSESIPNLHDMLKDRFKKAKSIGEQLRQSMPNGSEPSEKTRPNELCPCGSGKKFKKCCAQKLN